MVEAILPTIIGALIGILITHIYYRKQKEDQVLSTKATYFIKKQIEDLILTTKYPQYFESTEANLLYFYDEMPDDPDVPYLNTVAFDRKKLLPGEMVKILVRVSDNKWNFRVGKGIEIIGLYGEKLIIETATCGYISTEFKIPNDIGPGIHSLKISMVDTVGNKNEQEIPINIPQH